MEIRKSYLSMIKAFPGGADAIAAALTMSRAALENRIYERKGQGLLVDTAMQMQLFTGTTLFAQAVSAASGGAFVKLPDHGHLDNESIDRKFRELVAQLGTFSHHFTEATADDIITKREQAGLVAIADDMHRILAELLALSFKVFCPPAGADSDVAAAK